MDTQPIPNDEIEVDLVQVAQQLLKKSKWIVLSTLLCTLLATVYALGFANVEVFTEEPMDYLATARVYYLSTYLEFSEDAEYSMETYLAGDLQNFAASRTVVLPVMEALGIDLTYEEFMETVTVGVISGSHFLQYSVRSESEQEAVEIAQALRVAFCAYIGETLAVSAPVILEDVFVEEVEVLEEESEGSSALMLILAGTAIGFALSIGVILFAPPVVSFVNEVREQKPEEDSPEEDKPE